MPRFARTGLKACAAIAAFALVLGLAASPTVSAQQSLNLSVGGFAPRGVDARDPNDVLVNNLDPNRGGLAFDIKDFNTVTFSGEYLVGLGDKFEGGLGVGYLNRSVPSVYADFVNSNGNEIEQDLKLRIIPFEATVRFLPLGHRDAVMPYIGAGVGIFNWRYTETGEFLATDNTIFNGTFVGKGTATGPVIVGGLRVPVGSVDVGGEIRYQSAKGTLPTDQGFSGTTIDLGGLMYSFTVNFRF
jgi:hypothetical protein